MAANTTTYYPYAIVFSDDFRVNVYAENLVAAGELVPVVAEAFKKGGLDFVVANITGMI